jgi:ubiquitin carboxyl-terminal hydrolase 47
MGGHYYAYIKSFEDSKWYNFNDAIVSEIAEGSLNEKIQEMFGGNATSAYMLQYRKYDPKTVVNGVTQNAQIPNDEIPEYLKAELESEIDKLLKESLDM